MKTLNKNHMALMVTVVLILLGFLTGGIRPLSGLRTQGEAVFFNGTENFGPNSFNIKTDLQDFSRLAANAIFMANKYIGDTAEVTALEKSRIALDDALDNPNFRAGLLYSALNDVGRAADTLAEIMLNDSTIGMDPYDFSLFRGNASEMSSLELIIQRQGNTYNETAKDFNETLSKFPGSVFRATGLVKPLELFYNGN